METVATKRPNILLLITNQQRFDAMDCDGNPHIKTGYLDRLASMLSGTDVGATSFGDAVRFFIRCKAHLITARMLLAVASGIEIGIHLTRSVPRRSAG